MKEQKNILIFSDNRETRGIYESFGNSGNYILHYAAKNISSLNILMLQKFSLIVIEVMFPAISEIEFIETVSNFEKETPILVISSYFYETKEILFKDKISGFILKPFTFDMLCSTIDSIFSDELLKKEEALIKDPEYEIKKLSVLFEISRAIYTKTKFDELMNLLIKLSTKAFDCERATVYILDKETNELWSKVGTALMQQEIRFNINKGIAGQCALERKPMIVDDAYSNERFYREIDSITGFRTKNLLCVPMINLNGEVTGVFQLLNKIDGNFTKEDEGFLEALGATTGIAIENSLLKEQLYKNKDAIRLQEAEFKIKEDELKGNITAEVIKLIIETYQEHKNKKIPMPEVIKLLLIEKIKQKKF